MVKRTKYKSKRVEACPRCWGPVMINADVIGGRKLTCASCCIPGITFDEPVYFMSKIEVNIGRHLKSLELRGKIKELKTQENFDLVQVRWITAIGIYDHHFYSRLGEAKINGESILPNPYSHYKSDFTFIDPTGSKRVIEVKGLCKLKSKKKHGVTLQREPVYLVTKKDFPFFNRDQPFPQFVIKAKLMLLLYDLRVEVWTPGKWWAFDTSWKLREVGHGGI